MKDIYVSVAAAVLSAVSLTVSYMTYRRDKPNAKVIVFKTALIAGGGKTEPHMSINITNTGRRPIKIMAVGYRSFWKSWQSAVITAPAPIPKRLEEGDDVVCLFERSAALENGSWKGVAYVFATDTAGNEYRHNIAPFYKVLTFRALGKIINPFYRLRQHLRNKGDD